MPEGSYTSRLFDRGVNKIAQKVGEEAVETVIEAVAGNREAMIYEASDLVYHLLVLLEATGCSVADLEKELPGGTAEDGNKQCKNKKRPRQVAVAFFP